MADKNKMKVPQGSEGFFFEEAYIHRKVTEALQDLFNSWGYLPVETPVFDLFDAYRSLIPDGEADKVYRLIDRDGDLLMLRSDITLFLARQMGLILSEKDLPSRLCYSDSILRHQDSEDISHNEFFQSGIELIGKSGYRGDMEVLLLLSQTLLLLDIPSTVHLGSHALFNSVFSSFSDSQKKKILKLTSLREFGEIIKMCSAALGGSDAAIAAELFSFIGTGEELKEMTAGLEKKSAAVYNSASGELKYLNEVMEALKKAGCGDNFRIDLSEAGSQAYHSGIVFQVYMNGMDTAVISGGRYDNLLSNFGIDAPSVGFSLLQRKIEPGIGRKQRFSLPSGMIEMDEDEEIIESFLKAEKIRNEGKTVIL
ncbi:MAG: ATP phosphoribosyltransferase regulatory subunit [Spirochaetales bacterium]|nr:ATP phosphoribosyltransferase regulatory subunit [Spirochaetales bacterium]